MNSNILEIAKRAGVSIATVSRALSGKGPVKESTRNKIQKIAEELDYSPNPMAKSLSSKVTDTIGVVLPELFDEFFSELMRGIDEEAYRNQKYVMMTSSHSQRNVVETLLKFMGSGRVDGVILMIPLLSRDAGRLIRKSKRPVVLLNIIDNDKEFISFNIKNYEGAVMVTEHLIGHGFKKIGYIGGPRVNCDAIDRERGFLDAMRQNELEIHYDFIIDGDFTARRGYYGALRMLNQKNRPEAIVTANDMMALGVYEAANELGLNIPGDLAVVGFDDIKLSKVVQPRLTTVHVPIVELGSKATRYLFQMIDGEIDPKAHYREELATGLVVGESCGCTVKKHSFL